MPFRRRYNDSEGHDLKFIPTKIPDVILIEPDVFQDPRGVFFESYRKDLFQQHGIVVDFVQDNHSRSSQGVLRGLHYQIAPKEQAKLVRVVHGEAFDVVVDVRSQSKSFGHWAGHVLSAEKKNMLFIPAGFAHGFLSLTDDVEFIYKVSDLYSPAHERGILWNDPAIGIAWPKIDTPIFLSEKDKKYPTLQEIRF
jgi:dTDP-4-dehydrorhamnose 3,5-epimerase